MKNRIFFVFLLTGILSSCSFYLPGFDFNLFKNTPVEKLADAVEDEDLKEIEEFLKATSINIDYQEPRFGNTLLMLAIANNNNKAVKRLLELGANPKLKAFDSADAVMTAANNYYNNVCNTEILKLLISHGADVNSEQHIINNETHQASHTTALIRAISSGKCDSFIKTLVESGADLNRYLAYEGNGALSIAIFYNRLDVAKYLLLEKQAKIPEIIYIRDKGGRNEQKLTITDLLNEEHYKENSENFTLKQEILEFLKAKGVK